MSAAKSTLWALLHGYPDDKRQRRRLHRQAARRLFAEGGGIAASVARWHLNQARWL